MGDPISPAPAAVADGDQYTFANVDRLFEFERLLSCATSTSPPASCARTISMATCVSPPIRPAGASTPRPAAS